MSTTSSSPTETSQKAPPKQAKFVLLAKVGQLKREASQLHEEADSYCSIVTALVAGYTELLMWAEAKEREFPGLSTDLVTHSSNHTQLVKGLLHNLPHASISRERVLKLLNSDGLGMAMDVTEDGYVSPSSAQILRNVERAIVATKAA